MTDPTFNLLQLEQRPNWYDHLDSVEAAMREQDRIDTARFRANWTADEGGWYSPCGMHESDWADEDYPLPEDPEYADWASAFYHYEKLDAS